MRSWFQYFGCLTLLSFVGAQSGIAQEEAGEIETDRDSFTPAVSVVGQGNLMIESAWTFTDHADRKDTHSLPELLLRLGITENLELRFGTNYEVGGAASETSGLGFELEDSMELESETKVSYGIKAFLNEQDGWLPANSVILAGSTPVGGEETTSSLISTLVTGWRLENDYELHSAVRFVTGSAEEDSANTWAPSTVLKKSLHEQLNVHVEYFGIFSDGKAEETVKQFISPGVHYLPAPNFEVGIRTGWGLNEQSADFFSNIGFGWQF